MYGRLRSQVLIVNTQIKKIDAASLKMAVEIIQAGGLVAFPTETVYGLGADATNGAAVAQIFAAKGRPQDNPLIVHIADFSAVNQVARRITQSARLLSDAFMPGAITLVVEKNDAVSNVVTCGLNTVGVRVPSHEGARAFLRAVKKPIAAPSANTSKRPSPTSAQFVFDDMNGKVPLILDGGNCEVGIESTVVEVTGDVPVILRPGIITEEMIARVCGKVMTSGSASGVPHSPGMKYTHYAPSCEMVMVSGNFVQKINEIYGDDCVIMCYDRQLALFVGKRCISLGADNRTASNRFYRLLRETENSCRRILLVEPELDEVGKSLYNRMIKACSNRLI